MSTGHETERWHLIPRRLDAPPRFLLWDFDTVAILFAGLGFGIIANTFLLGGISSVCLVWAWTRMKAGRHPGYGFHLLYWHTPIQPFKRTPISARRNFVG